MEIIHAVFTGSVIREAGFLIDMPGGGQQVIRPQVSFR